MLRGQELQLRGERQPQVDEVAASELCCGEEAQILDTGCPFGSEPPLLPPKPGEKEHAARSHLVGSAEDGCALPAPEDPAVEELAECQEAAGMVIHFNFLACGCFHNLGHHPSQIPSRTTAKLLSRTPKPS